MILSCNSCEKKFVVPDNAITASGRLVQCSSCGNKWKQFPILATSSESKKSEVKQTKSIKLKSTTGVKTKKKLFKKKSTSTLYTPEYLIKKHGIVLKDQSNIKGKNDTYKINFGFYNALLVLIIALIAILRLLFFSQNIIVKKFPFTENYIYYLFETIINIKLIIENFLIQ